MLVSAIITTCKRPADIVERALKSVLAQTYSELEVIIVDDSPSDFAGRAAVSRMAEKYPTVRYIQLERNMGAGAARNIGIENSRGEFIAFLDDDDEWFPEKTEKQLAAFSSDKIGLVYCGNKRINDVSGEESVRDKEFHKGCVFDILIKGNFIGSTSFPLIRKSCLLDIGGFDPEQQSAQDFDVWLKIAGKWEISYVEDVLGAYHKHDLGRITTNYAKKVSGAERLNRKYEDYLAAHPDARHARLIKMSLAYARNRQYRKAFSVYWTAVLLKPMSIKCNVRYLYYLLRWVARNHAKKREGGTEP